MKHHHYGLTGNLSLLACIVFSAIFIFTPQTSAKLMAAAASPNSITLTWTAPGDDGSFGTASQYDIRYSLSPITDQNWDAATVASNPPVPQPAGSVENFVVDGLLPSTTYYFAIKVADEVPNWSVMSNVISRSTDAETDLPDIIADLSVAAVSASSVTLSWTASGDDGVVGTASTYDIRYSTSSITDLNWDAATQATGEPSPQSAGSDESFTVTNLNSGTQYYFAIKVADEVPNWSALSNIANGITANETVAPAAIANLQVGTPTDNSAVLFWTAPGDDGNVGQASQYDIRYSTSAINNGNFSSATPVADIPAPKAAGQPETLLVTDLNQEVTYYFAIKTADEVPNWSDLSNTVSTTTVDMTPPAGIDDLQSTTGQAVGSIDLSWTAPGDNGDIGTASLYEIRIAPERFDESTWTSASLFISPPIPEPAGTEQFVSIDNLNPGQIYFTAIKSYDMSGNASVISNIDSAEARINISTDIDDDMNNGLPGSFALGQNYPNPFNPTTSINFSLPRQSLVDLSVYNIEGKKVATLITGDYPAGEHSIEWDGTTSSGRPAATGVYFYRLTSESYSDTKKMVMLK